MTNLPSPNPYNTHNPRTRRATLDSRYAKYLHSTDNAGRIEEMREALAMMLEIEQANDPELIRQGKGPSRRDMGSHYMSKSGKIASMIEAAEKQVADAKILAHELRTVRGTVEGYHNAETYIDLLALSDDEIDQLKPTEGVEIFAKVIAAFPDLYTRYMGILEKRNQERLDGTISPGDQATKDLFERNKKRIESGKSPIQSYVPRESVNVIIETIGCIMALRSNKQISTRGDYRMILRVIKNPDCKDYSPMGIALIRKVIEVMGVTDNEVATLLIKTIDNKYEIYYEIYSRSRIPQLQFPIRGYSKKAAIAVPHLVIEDNDRKLIASQSEKYKQELIRFIRVFREKQADGWGYDNIVRNMFSDDSAPGLVSYNESLLTENRKRLIVSQVLTETGFTSEEAESLIDQQTPQKHSHPDF